MKIEVSIVANFYLTLTLEMVEALHWEASHHYDSHCKSYAADYSNTPDALLRGDGLLTCWKRRLDNLEAHQTEWEFRCTFAELDTLSKICEMGLQKPLIRQFAMAIGDSMRYFNANANTFPMGTITFGTTPLASPDEM